MIRTDVWRIDPVAPTLVPTHSAWRETKDICLQAFSHERAAIGCECDAPPWFSEPGRWPLQIMLVHNLDCPLDGTVPQVIHTLTPATVPALAGPLGTLPAAE